MGIVIEIRSRFSYTANDPIYTLTDYRGITSFFYLRDVGNANQLLEMNVNNKNLGMVLNNLGRELKGWVQGMIGVVNILAELFEGYDDYF